MDLSVFAKYVGITGGIAGGVMALITGAMTLKYKNEILKSERLRMEELRQRREQREQKIAKAQVENHDEPMLTGAAR